MAKLAWDKIGERFYETGVDRGVLYPQSSGTYPKGVAWNGLTKVSESPSGAEATALYANNRKYLNLYSAEDFGGTIEAYTYPDEFGECNGEGELLTGVSLAQQTRKPFGLAYRSIIGNDTELNKHGYKLHLVYGAMASPSEVERSTVNDSPEAATLSWEFTTTPVEVTGFEPTAHLVIDSTKVDKAKLAALETILYGADAASGGSDTGTDPRLPLPDEVAEILGTTEETVGG